MPCRSIPSHRSALARSSLACPRGPAAAPGAPHDRGSPSARVACHRGRASSRRRGGWLLCAALALGACRGPAAPGAAPATLIARVTPAVATEVIARVDDAPLLRDDCALQLDAEGDARRALDRAIDEELLAQEALRRGLGRDVNIARAQRRALAQRLIERDFIERLPPSAIPRRLVERAYELNRTVYLRPEVRELVHILVVATPKDDAVHHRRALAFARRAHALTSTKPLTAAEFRAAGRGLSAAAAPLKLRIEDFLAAPGETVPAFSAAAFALRRAGQVSAVVPTEFGYHVIYLKGIQPPRSRSLAQVEQEIRQRIVGDARRVLLDERLDQLRKRVGVRVDEAQAGRALGLSGS